VFSIAKKRRFKLRRPKFRARRKRFIKPRPSIQGVARRGRFRRRSSGRGRFGLGRVGSIFKSAAAGIGGAIVATEITNRFFPQASGIAGPAGAYVAGGIIGIASHLLLSAGGGLFNFLGVPREQPMMTEAV